MNVLLWVLQVVLAMLCISGGAFQIFKLDQLKQQTAAMRALPAGLWGFLGAWGCVAGERLKSSTLATTVRQHAGKTEVLDGPYADTKEQLAGYFIVEVLSLDEAIIWAKRCPSSKYGSIEIRPMLDQSGLRR